MATSAIHYNVSTITRHPLQPASSSNHGDPLVTLSTFPHLLMDKNHHHHHLNTTADDNNNNNNANVFTTNTNDNPLHMPTLPSWLDPDAFGSHADFFPYSGDVQYLTLPWVREPNFIPLVAVHVVTFLLGIAGNLLVISVLCCGRPGRCVTFPCLLSMAAADVLFLAVCVPHKLLRYFLTHWALSSLLCKLSGFVEMLCALAAVLNLILISLER
ncbi:hypothetical protein ACOMHN_003131 [Nucella lapillus]